MWDRILNFILEGLGFRTGIKRPIEDSDEEDVNEVQRKIRKTDSKPYVTSSDFLCPAPNWRMPKKKPASNCRQQERNVERRSMAFQPSVQAGCSWFEDSKENIIDVSDDEDPEVLGEWQDSKTLRKRPIFKGSSRTEASASSRPKTDEDDVQVVKVVESHSEEIARSGNRLSIFQTPSARGPVSQSRQLSTGSGSSRKTPVLLLRLKSSSKYSQESNESQSSASARSSQAEERRSKTILNESIRLEEKQKYSELLQRFTSVPLSSRGRIHTPVWSPSLKTSLSRDESTPQSYSLAAKVRDKFSKESPILVDLTKPHVTRSTHSLRKRIEVRKDREVQPYTLTTKKDEASDQQVDSPFTSSNSLAQALKSNYFCNGDLIASINEKYKRKREARERQEKEEKLKASHFQERDKKLHMEALERMTNYLKLTDAILEDEVIAEEKDLLPELTPDMQNVIDAALIPKPAGEVLVEAFGLPIKRHDMQTLAGLNWLNDEVINFYMELLKERGKLENYPTVYSFNTFFYPRLLSGGHSALKRWTRKVNIFSFDLIIVPVHLGVHWCMAAVDFRKKAIKYFDSMGSANNKCLQSLLKYLQDESLDKLKKPFDTSDWNTENVQKIPQQMNGSDCGMFSCMYAEYICRNAEITFTQQDMPYFRRKMVYEIYTRKLLL